MIKGLIVSVNLLLFTHLFLNIILYHLKENNAKFSETNFNLAVKINFMSF